MLTQRSYGYKGRWASDGYKAYVRGNGKDAGWVASVITRDGLGNCISRGKVLSGGELVHLLELDVPKQT